MKSVIVLVFCFSINLLLAQENEFRVSGGGSFNLLSMKSKEAKRDYTFGVGGLNYSIGARAKYAILDHQLMFTGSLLITKLKYKSKNLFDVETEYKSIDFNSTYLQTPLTIGWGAITSHNFNLSFPFGIIPSILMRSNSTVYGPNLDNSSPKTKNFFMGYQGGAQVSYTKNFKLFMAAQPNFVFYPNGFDDFDSQQAMGFQLFITVGYIFK